MNTGNTVSQCMQITYCIVGLIGNALCLIIFTRPSTRSSYVFLLIGLASFDILTLIKGLLSGLKVLGTIDYNTQSTGTFFFRWICDIGTKYFTVVIAAERYFVICHPIRSLKWNNDNRGAILAIATLIFIALASSFSYIYWNFINLGNLIYQSIVLSFVPFILVVTFSVGIAYGVHKFNKKQHLGKSQKRDVSATKMLLAVTGFFGICIFFEVTRRIMTISGYYKPGTDYYDYTISHLSDHFYLLNSTANFIIYGVMYKRFRDEFSYIFCNKTKSSGEISNTHSTDKQ